MQHQHKSSGRVIIAGFRCILAELLVEQKVRGGPALHGNIFTD
jgi:hypothetical protein